MADYANRTDLQNPAAKMAATTAKGQTYGAAKQQMDAQRAVPMGPPPTAAAPQQPVQRPTPGQVVDLAAPTQRPQDTLMPMMNNSPMILDMANPVIEELNALYQMFPNDDLASLLSAIKYDGQ